MADAAEIAELLRVFVEEQRRAALSEQRLNRIVVVREFGTNRIQGEIMIDEKADTEEICAVLAPLGDALDRLEAKHRLNQHYANMIQHCGVIQNAIAKRDADASAYHRQNARHNEQRRIEVGLTAQQIGQLEADHKGIVHAFERLEEMKADALKLKRQIAGSSQFAQLEAEVAAYESELRGQRQSAA